MDAKTLQKNLNAMMMTLHEFNEAPEFIILIAMKGDEEIWSAIKGMTLIAGIITIKDGMVKMTEKGHVMAENIKKIQAKVASAKPGTSEGMTHDNKKNLYCLLSTLEEIGAAPEAAVEKTITDKNGNWKLIREICLTSGVISIDCGIVSITKEGSSALATAKDLTQMFTKSGQTANPSNN